MTSDLYRCPSPEVGEQLGARLQLVGVSRRQMGAFMCIARNSVPPAVSRRIMLHVHCEW